MPRPAHTNAEAKAIAPSTRSGHRQRIIVVSPRRVEVSRDGSTAISEDDAPARGAASNPGACADVLLVDDRERGPQRRIGRVLARVERLRVAARRGLREAPAVVSATRR